MSVSQDDKFLGEKAHYYCSSDEDEGEDDDDNVDERGDMRRGAGTESVQFIPEAELKQAPGTTRTGPKGVINDWREYKRLESERREEQDQEAKALLQKLSMTCRSHLDDEKAKHKEEKSQEDIDNILEDFEDEFLREYRQRRIQEMRAVLEKRPKFGKVITLDASGYGDAIDKEKPQVTVIVHIYEQRVSACDTMNKCLVCLAQEYPTVKFCKIKASDTHLSLKFVQEGVPALLVYKAGELIGNLIRVSDELSDDFYANDLESYLHEHGFLPTQDIINQAIRDKATGELRSAVLSDDSDSDFGVD